MKVHSNKSSAYQAYIYLHLRASVQITKIINNLMKYSIYKTTNLINKKIYIGCHKTDDPNDDYLGSGKYLKKAISKYGIENFKKEVLFVFDNPEEMFAKELELVTEEFCKREDTYNLKKGGSGGWDHITWKNKKRDLSSRKKMSEAAKKRVGEKNNFFGKSHTKETRAKIGRESKKRAKAIYDIRIEKGNHPNSKVICPHCNKEGQMRAMKRWHFSNCKKLQESSSSHQHIQVPEDI